MFAVSTRVTSGLRSALLNHLPPSLRSFLVEQRRRRIKRKYAALPLAEAFDRIYLSGAWGRQPNQPSDSIFSGGGGPSAASYCSFIVDFLHKQQPPAWSVVDLGCGDFSIGRIISQQVPSYTGVDISKVVIEHNSAKYATQKVRFVQGDLTSSPLPHADIALVRQVLQHLSNTEVQRALDNLVHSYATIVITEHIYTGPSAQPNIDTSHGPGTRVLLKSGIHPDKPPFSLKTSVPVDIDCGEDTVLRTWIIRCS